MAKQKLTLEKVYEQERFDKLDTDQKIYDIQDDVDIALRRTSQIFTGLKAKGLECLSVCELQKLIKEYLEGIDIYLDEVEGSTPGTLVFKDNNPETPDISVDLCPHVVHCETKTTLAKHETDEWKLVYTSENSTDTIDFTSWLTADNLYWSGINTGLTGNTVQGIIDDVINTVSLIDNNDGTFTFTNPKGQDTTIDIDNLLDNTGDLFTVTDGTTPFGVANNDTVTLASSGGAVSIDTSTSDQVDINVVISSDIGNTLAQGTDDGLYAPTYTETTTLFTQDVITGVITYTDEASVESTANVISTDVDNSISVGSDGGAYLNVQTPSFDITDGTTTESVDDGDTITFQDSGDILTQTVTSTDTVVTQLRQIRDEFSSLVTGDTVDITQTPMSGGAVQVFRNGLLLRETDDYTIAGSTITFVRVFGPSSGGASIESVDAIYFY